MTDFTANSTAIFRQPLSFFAGLASFFAGMAVGYRTYVAYNELSQLSDAELGKLNITRADVPRVAAKHLFD